MASPTNGKHEFSGLIVPLGWELSDNNDWVDTPENVRRLTGITRYNYTRMFQTQIPMFRLRFTNTATISYVFNDSQGRQHPIRPLFIGTQEVNITALEGPSIVSVTLPLKVAQEEGTPTDALSDALCTEVNWPVTEEVQWVAPGTPIEARTGIKEYSYSWRMLGGVKHYFLDIFNITSANYVFKDRSGHELHLSAKSGGKNEVVSPHMDGGPIVSVCVMKN